MPDLDFSRINRAAFRILMVKSDWRWWIDFSCWAQIKLLRRPAAIEPRKSLEPWEEAVARELAKELRDAR